MIEFLKLLAIIFVCQLVLTGGGFYLLYRLGLFKRYGLDPHADRSHR